jgi:Putative MetA-pathway of phenol degradation
MRFNVVAALLIAAASPPALANDDPSASLINTDRPAVTDSSVVVPVGSLQFENGFEESSGNTFDATETLVRFGIAPKTELRLVAPDYFGVLDAGSGFGDLSAGIKQQLGPAAGFDVSLVLMLSFPTGSHEFSSHGYDPSVQLPWSRSLSANWTAAGMFSVYFPTVGPRRNVTGETTFLIDRQLTKTWDAFVEYAGDFPGFGGPRHLIQFGTAFKVKPQQQLDLHVGATLSSAAVDHFIGVGYSFRFQPFQR